VAQVQVVSQFVHEGTRLLLDSAHVIVWKAITVHITLPYIPPAESHLEVVTREFRTAGTGGGAELLMGPQRVVVCESPWIVRAEIGRVGLDRVEAADAGSARETKVGDVEIVLVLDGVADVHMQRDAVDAVGIGDVRVGKCRDHGV